MLSLRWPIDYHLCFKTQNKLETDAFYGHFVCRKVHKKLRLKYSVLLFLGGFMQIARDVRRNYAILYVNLADMPICTLLSDCIFNIYTPQLHSERQCCCFYCVAYCLVYCCLGYRAATQHYRESTRIWRKRFTEM